VSKIILGVHGLSNKPPKDVLYEQGWKLSMLEGMKKNENAPQDDIAFEGIYWADQNYDEPDTTGETYRPAAANALKAYDEGFIEDIVQSVETLGGNIIDWFKSKFDIDKTANAILEKKVVDLHRYYTEPDNFKKLTGLVTEALESHAGKQIMIIGHSMGSIIAYDALRMLGREHNNISIDHFVTIGSPLGLPHVKLKNRELHGTTRTPTLVKRWTNFADRRDPVASDEHLNDDYKANVAGVRVQDNLVLNDWRVNSGVDIFHKSYGYLRTPEFSKILAEFV